MARDGLMTRVKGLATTTLQETEATTKELLNTVSTASKGIRVVASETVEDLKSDLVTAKVNFVKNFNKARQELMDQGMSKKEAEEALNTDL